MKEIVNKLHDNRQIELAKRILESNGYRVTKGSKELQDSMIPVPEDIGRFRDLTDYNYSEEEIEYYKEEFEDAAAALGTTIDNILYCTEDNAVEAYEYFQDRFESAEEVKKLLSVPGVYRGLYRLEDGTQFVMHADWGYVTYFFVDPNKKSK